jgi:hypothetical protein
VNELELKAEAFGLSRSRVSAILVNPDGLKLELMVGGL